MAHKQIKHFFVAPEIVEWLGENRVKFPACICIIESAKVDKAIRQTVFQFSFWFVDLTNVSAKAMSNEIEVLSDLTSVAEDFDAMINAPQFEDDWTIGQSGTLEYYTEQFTDWVAAVKMTVNIGVDYVSDRCQIPTDLDFTDVAKGFILGENGEFIIAENENKKLSTE